MDNQESINQILNAVKTGHASPEFAAMMITNLSNSPQPQQEAMDVRKKVSDVSKQVSERAAQAAMKFGKAAKQTHDGVRDALPLSQKAKNTVGSALVIALFIMIIVGAVATGFVILKGVGALLGGLLGSSVASSLLR